MGAGPQGSGDVRAFQRAILRGEFRTVPSLLMPLALKSTVLRRDSATATKRLSAATPGANRCALSACVLAAGLAAGAAGDGGFGISAGTAGMNRDTNRQQFYQGREWRNMSSRARGRSEVVGFASAANRGTVAAASGAPYQTRYGGRALEIGPGEPGSALF